jgi:DNA-binding phage protein
MNGCSLYRHWDANGRLLYVGVSLSALARLRRHRHVSNWQDLIAEVKIEHFENRKLAMAAEREAILQENPLFNGGGNREMHEVSPVVADLVEKIKASGKTRTQVARDAGVAERQIYHLLTGERNCRAQILTKVARAIGYDVRLVKVKS